MSVNLKFGQSPFHYYTTFLIVTAVLYFCVRLTNANDTETSDTLRLLGKKPPPPILLAFMKASDVLVLHLSGILSSNSGNTFALIEDLRKTSPYFDLTTVEFISNAGYPIEQHEVVTEDGYVLTLHRIPHGMHENPLAAGTSKIPVLIQHGFLCSSSDWLMQPVEKALPYMLVETGLYDVWLGNIRGNRYSQGHKHLKTSDKAFWEFSHDESGKYDVKAMVDHILETSGHSKLYYIGHSMGNNLIYDFLSEKPNYNSKFKLVVSLAPAAFLGHMKSPLRHLALLSVAEKVVLNTAGSQQLNLDTLKALVNILGPHNCQNETVYLDSFCKFGAHTTGMDANLMSDDWIPIIYTQYPDTSSTKTLSHLMQSVYSGRFAKFDYGIINNFRNYGHPNVPEYQLSRITAPVAIFAANDDVLVDIEDVRTLRKRLPNVKSFQTVDAEKFNHAGFLYAVSASDLVYEPVLKLMRTIE